MMGEMDSDKRMKLVDRLKALGVDEGKIDDNILWAVKKISYKVNELRMYLDKEGLDESKAKEVVNKLVAEALEKDLAKIKEWHEEYGHDHVGCCMHCNMCHHMSAKHDM